MAASDCIREMGNYLGKNILKGRVENINPDYLPIYLKIMDTTNEMMVKSYEQQNYMFKK